MDLSESLPSPVLLLFLWAASHSQTLPRAVDPEEETPGASAVPLLLPLQCAMFVSTRKPTLDAGASVQQGWMWSVCFF